MDEVNGRVYSKAEGLRAVLERIHSGELPSPKLREDKPAKWNF